MVKKCQFLNTIGCNLGIHEWCPYVIQPSYNKCDPVGVFLCPHVGRRIVQENTISDKPIVYHINDPDFRLPSKENGKYIGVEWLWGNMITNKATRSDSKFAEWIEPDGTVRHTVSHAGFVRFFKKTCIHKELPIVSKEEFRNICEKVHDMNPEQIADLIKCLVCSYTK